MREGRPCERVFARPVMAVFDRGAMPAALGLAGAAPNARRYGAPFHLGGTGMPEASLPALPQPAINASAAKQMMTTFFTSSSLWVADDATE